MRRLANEATSHVIAADPIDLELTSDLVAIYYKAHRSGDSAPRLDLSKDLIPLDVKERIREADVAFEKVSGLLQRALLWDSGYALVDAPSNPGKVVAVIPIQVKCGLRMADIAPSRVYVRATGCDIADCSSRNGSTNATVHSFRAASCQPSTVSASRCAVAKEAVAAITVPITQTTSMWAVGALAPDPQEDGLPMFWLRQHGPPDTSPSYAIHTAPSEDSDMCPLVPSLIIPCATLDVHALAQEWCRPDPSPLVSAWLSQEERKALVLSKVVLLAGAIILCLALDLFAIRKPRVRVAAQIVSLPSLTSTMLDVTGQRSHTRHTHQRSSHLSSVRSNR
ncbi:hypothetical protein ATCC90586_004341 [Pythium insidiosum]|nr:hypothetical protein ATCC90586_004341 [Pythium insidiosum]